MASSAPAKTTKYDGFLGNRRAPAEPEPIEREAVVEEPLTPASTQGQKAGSSKERLKGKAKTQDKRYKGYTLLLKIHTHTDANSILKKMELGKGENREDLSDLTERLLSAWVETHLERRR